MEAPPDNDVLWARSLHFTHRDGSPGLAGISLGVRQGEILAVSGPRGSGKTTLLRCLSGLLPVRSGEVWFNSSPCTPSAPPPASGCAANASPGSTPSPSSSPS